MHIPQYFERQDLACDVYGSSTANSTAHIGKYQMLFVFDIVVKKTHINLTKLNSNSSYLNASMEILTCFIL